MSLFLVIVLLLSGCGQETASETGGAENQTAENTVPLESDDDPSNPESEGNSSNPESEDNSEDAAIVYFTSDISAEGMLAIYEASWMGACRQSSGKVLYRRAARQQLPGSPTDKRCGSDVCLSIATATATLLNQMCTILGF